MASVATGFVRKTRERARPFPRSCVFFRSREKALRWLKNSLLREPTPHPGQRWTTPPYEKRVVCGAVSKAPDATSAMDVATTAKTPAEDQPIQLGMLWSW